MTEHSPLTGTFLESLTAFDLASDEIGRSFTIRVVTPPGYEQSGIDHPVLVVTDGAMMVATAAESVAVQAMLAECAPLIVVGVSSTGSFMEHNVHRVRDYTPGPAFDPDDPANTEAAAAMEAFLATAGTALKDGFGGSEAFLGFLTDTLLPRLAEDYRVDTGELGISGHSAGGALLSDILLRKTSPFRKFLVGSFAVSWYGTTLADREAAFAALPAPHPVEVFCGYGSGEETDFGAETIGGAVALLQRLQAADPDYIQRLEIHRFEGRQHGSVVAPLIGAGIHELWGTGLAYGHAARKQADAAS